MPKRAWRLYTFCTTTGVALYLLMATTAALASPHAGMLSTGAIDFPGFVCPAAPARETARLCLTDPSRLADAPSLTISAAEAAPLKPPTPLVFHAVGEEPSPVTKLGPFYYPGVQGLVGSDQDERAVPLGSTSVMGLNPGGFGRVMSGRPLGRMGSWSEASETSISYVRPHINAQMVVSLDLPGTNRPADFEGMGIQPRAYLDIEHFSRLDAADIGRTSDRFGRHLAPPRSEEPETAVAVGLDLGILPTFLAQMGMSVSLVATRGQETGGTRLALVGTTELPVDWRPHERPIDHPRGLAVNPIDNGPVAAGYSGGGGVPSSTVPTSAGGGGGGDGPIPITPTPPVPEPATLTLLGSALVAVIAARRARGK
jgi:hypothetical protein